MGDTHRSYDADELAGAIGTGGFAPRDITIAPVKLPLGVTGLLATAVKKV